MKYLYVTLLLGMTLSVSTVRAEGIDRIFLANVEPYVMEMDTGFHGPIIDIIDRIMTAAGNPVTTESYQYIVWARALRQARNEAGIALAGLAKTPDREEQFKWVGPLGTLRLDLWARTSNHIRLSTIQDSKKHTICVVRASAPENILVSQYNFTERDLVRVRSENIQLKMLEAGRVAIAVLPAMGVEKAFARLGLNPGEYEMVWSLAEQDLYLALNKETDDDLMERLQNALDQLKVTPSGESKNPFQKIYDEYQ